MDTLLRLFDLFNETARKVAGYLPQSGDDVLHLLKQLMAVAGNFNDWIATNIGINLQGILSAIGRIIILSLTFILDLLKALVERI